MYDLGPLKPGAFVRMFQHGSRFAAISMLAATLSSCGTFTNPGAPKQSFDIDKDIQELETVFSRSGSIAEYYAEFEKSAKTDEQRKKGRDRFITGRLVLINIHYIEFIKQFAVSKAQLDSAIDIATIGVDLAITLVGAASTKGILGAVSAGLTSSKVSIDKNFFQQKTVPVLISTMNAQRKEALLPILAGMKKSVTDYPLAEAVADLHAYYSAGTFLGALQAIQKDSGVKEAKADKKITKIKQAAGFTKPEFQKRVLALVEMIKKLPDENAKELATNPPVKLENKDVISYLNRVVRNKGWEDDGKKARKALKIRVTRGQRSETMLNAWEAALK